MKMNQDLKVDLTVDLTKDESYLIFGSIIELGGPYHSHFSQHLSKFHKTEYEKIKETIKKDKIIWIKDIPLLLETLHLLIYEMSDGDFLALYDGVTKEDVKALYEKLQKIYDEYSSAIDAFRHTAKTGELVKGTDHAIKINEYFNGLNNLLKNNLSNGDRQKAEWLANNIKDALKGGVGK